MIWNGNVVTDRNIGSTKRTDNEGLKCAIDHILDAQKKGEISEDNVLYIVENINVAGNYYYFCFANLSVIFFAFLYRLNNQFTTK